MSKATAPVTLGSLSQTYDGAAKAADKTADKATDKAGEKTDDKTADADQVVTEHSSERHLAAVQATGVAR